jgi:hypothetical protein
VKARAPAKDRVRDHRNRTVIYEGQSISMQEFWKKKHHKEKNRAGLKDEQWKRFNKKVALDPVEKRNTCLVLNQTTAKQPHLQQDCNIGCTFQHDQVTDEIKVVKLKIPLDALLVYFEVKNIKMENG